MYQNEYGEEINNDLLELPEVTSKFKALTSEELMRILGITIKRDETNKLVTFLTMLSAYTNNSQMNLSFNAPSSSGKSFIPLEISQLFPSEDLIKLGSCSPTAFFHEQGNYDKENNVIRVNLERKNIIFLDQPDNNLLGRLRALLSHDEKEIQSKITDKNQRGGNRTKTVIIRGFPSVIFCSAGLRFDEQEATRFLMLSPEINQEKLREGIHERIKRGSDSVQYDKEVSSDPDRNLLKERILAIKERNVGEIKIASQELVEKMFLNTVSKLKPRHQRDVGRVMSLVKVFALLNLWDREWGGSVLVANDDDVKEAFKLWNVISESQELSLPPYVLDLYKDVILATCEKNSEMPSGEPVGLTRQQLVQKHYEIYGRFLPDWQLRQQILPMLETSGLIIQEPDPMDARKMRIYPTILLSKSKVNEYSELSGGLLDGITENKLNIDPNNS